ncbi:TPA: hypothetical protein ENS27_11780, partial [bacterium]|nr:hypothetical protein [bacterium]
MTKLFRITIFLTICFVISVIIGCGGENEPEGDKIPPTVVSTTPETGGQIYSNGTIVIKFSEKMNEITISEIDGTIEMGDGINVKWTPKEDMSEGNVSIKINGSDMSGNKLIETAIIL